MEYVIGLASSLLTGPRPVSQRTSKFARELVYRKLGSEVYALCETAAQMSSLRFFYAPFEGLNPGMIGSEDCESPFAHLKTKKMLAEQYLARYFLRIQQALEKGEVDNAYWLPGTENSAYGFTKVRSDMAPSCDNWKPAISIQGRYDR